MIASSLLPFQEEILKGIQDQDGLLILARGLGIRTIISYLLDSYIKQASNLAQDSSASSLVFLVNSSSEDDVGINNEIGMRMTCIGHEVGSKERERIYKNGGVLSITSRILIVDMLNSIVSVPKIKGLVIMHAEKVTPTSMEAFIVRVFKSFNLKGFIKAFSEEPEEFTCGISPLQTVMTQLKIRVAFLWPRFQSSVKKVLEVKKPKVIELHQPMSESMLEIQTAIIESMEATLSEIRRCNTNLEVEDLTFENALFRSFDIIIRSRLNPIWHRVTPKTKQLVSDLATLRWLLTYLLHFDCVAFYKVLETILVASTSETSILGSINVKSPWLSTSAADTIFSLSKSRIYIKSIEGEKSRKVHQASNGISSWVEGPTEEEEEAMRELEEGIQDPRPKISNTKNGCDDWNWLPAGVLPVMEEQPKWQLLKEVVAEIEAGIFQEDDDKGSNLILVMCSSKSTCETLKEHLATIADPPDPKYGVRPMMRRRLRSYFFWKGALGKVSRNIKKPIEPAQSSSKTSPTKGQQGISAAMKRKEDTKKNSNYFSKRRRVRGAGNISVGDSAKKGPEHETKPNDPVAVEKEAIEIADMLDSVAVTSSKNVITEKDRANEDEDSVDDDFNEENLINCFELMPVDDLVVICPYLGDEDDRILEALRPRYIIMYEVDVAFVRRVECYQSRNPDLQVVPYFLMYSESVEEQKYLSMIRREKESFEKLIRENSTMVIPLDVEARPNQGCDDGDFVHTISSRLAGGRSVSNSISKVVVDVREFRSSLPSLLHAAKFMIEPTTLIVGDYILSPEMCVERKSIADLAQSFNSGRLYQQCEMMTAHYKQPILLIEFDEKKSFTLDTYSDIRGASSKSSVGPNETDLQAKLVLLTLSFPKLRLIWSSSPYSTAEIFRDLKLNHAEPDSEVSSLIGLEAESSKLPQSKIEQVTSGLCPTSQEVLKALPGIDGDILKVRKLFRFGIRNFNELLQLSERDFKNLLGVESGSRLNRFIQEEIDRK
ncbi:hypothetical protein BY996DRAFT_4584876 [Phakopsora pachyrhizi]|uniref:ERCC4 domain-containing protein n=1 Tax=Phakopsora pachyrhizi TaxID=170000 RepID=A0AAV0AIW5_PHAPC|nr:hypothetical protein BY996DRAFT_4584876 [Phakopsora pachyrhizi]CAH7667918.1 hypothetical protein PPACK8108_LOCUS2360 [Phakopsora pachyrhizi]